MSYKNTNYSLFLILFKLTILYTADLAASDCLSDCGGIEIPFPFGTRKGCYLDEHYKIECKETPTSRKLVPVLSSVGVDVVSITPPSPRTDYRYGSFDSSRRYGLVRVKIPTVSTGCRNDGKESGTLNLTGSPFFVDAENSLVALGCNSRVSLTQIKPSTVVCELNCNTRRDSRMINNIPFLKETECSVDLFPVTNENEEVCSEEEAKEIDCDGNGCCRIGLSEPQQVVGINITSNDENSASCRVAFLTDEVYDLSNSTKPQELFHKRYATVTLGWVIQTNKTSFLKSLNCQLGKDSTTHSETNCTCGKNTISGIIYANCECNKGYKGNPYDKKGCEDIDECKNIPEICGKGGTCENTIGSFQCSADKTKAIVLGLGSGFGALALVGGVWWLRKFLIKKRMEKRKKKFFKRNGGLLLQQKLNTREGNVETTRIFSSRELKKATENFSENRVLGRGGQGTVYKGMLLDGRTVAVKKSKVVDEDKLQEFINEVVILSQINHRHVVKLLGCCLETEVPMLVYEFIVNGNLFKHIHEESDDYAMVWGMRLRVAVDVAGALSYLHSFATSPIYHRDVKSANILLDEKYRAKVADFGTSRSITIDQTHWTTVVSGTVGYVDPEYYRSSQYTEKSDVYSFGVILAELITGDKPVVMLQNTQEIISLAEHFRLAMKEMRLSDIMDARIKDDCKPEQVMAVAHLALKCLSSKGKKRPNMREVFMELERICSSPEDSQVVQIQNDEEDGEEEEEEEVRNMINKGDSLSVGVTAPAFSIEASSSSSDAEPLFPRLTW
ncbi:PREDICTED: wall-associated receptor kinase-like 18 [Brassica oleracea var. oleracea]|uniref:Protein kinase domain-containing protein n=1 Tax=Brassica oleracea var. oleracea TaxID=109376 RepID=A0A0D3A2Y9_BRAOL|nr:PREDICTED: wall-associated receptor kinase-like 18 [Brassica oleracea var. oleracea]